MISYGYELNEGFVLPLAALQALLKNMSEGEHQWLAVPVPHIIPASDNEPRGYVAIGFTNPEQVNFPNYIAFLFPMLSHGTNPATVDNLLVCLHPQSASPLTRG